MGVGRFRGGVVLGLADGDLGLSAGIISFVGKVVIMIP